MVAGRVPSPPISSTLDFADFVVEPGPVTVELDPAEFHMNPLGSVHGGVIAALLDNRLRVRGAQHPAGRDRLHPAWI